MPARFTCCGPAHRQAQNLSVKEKVEYMLQEHQEIIDKFETLLRRYAVLFSEITMLDDPDDIFYVSDPETYELCLISRDITVGGELEGGKGRKCYELLQNRSSPCPFCTSSLLSTDQYYIWEHYNQAAKKNFLIKDRLFDWNGRKMRIEVALNITKPEQAKKVLIENANQQNLMMHWMRCLLKQEPPEEAFSLILEDLKNYFQAESGFIRSFTSIETVRFFSKGGCGLNIPYIEQLDSRLLERWERLIGKNKLILIRSVDELADRDPESYHFLTGYGLHNLCLAPIICRDRLVGLICLGNLKQRWASLFLLEVLGDYVAASVQRITIQEEKAKIQYTDPLTGRLNFEGFKIRVEHILKNNPGRKYALHYCDIKKFKFINEAYGYDTGDRILKYWSDYLASICREDEVFCRISGDTLTYLLYYENELSELEKNFKEMSVRISDYPELYRRRHHIELACGVYLIDASAGCQIGEMMNRANMAQKSIKIMPGSHLGFYTDTMRQKEMREMEFVANMHEAIRKKEFKMFFQPQLSTRAAPDQSIRAEVLVRWQQNGTIIAMPGEFVDLFERNGFIVDLDHYMFEHVCIYLNRTLPRCRKQLVLSVNVSRITMLQPNFIDYYCSVKNRYQIPSGHIELEFTESVVVEDVAYFGAIIKRLNDNGFLCAMDDFGTGQSSLNVLQALPLDILKLDQMFFRDKTNERRKHIIVANILKMARQLRMVTVAEGIESAEQVRELTEMGCDYIQGYYFSQPVTADEFEMKYLEEL